MVGQSTGSTTMQVLASVLEEQAQDTKHPATKFQKIEKQVRSLLSGYFGENQLTVRDQKLVNDITTDFLQDLKTTKEQYQKNKNVTKEPEVMTEEMDTDKARTKPQTSTRRGRAKMRMRMRL